MRRTYSFPLKYMGSALKLAIYKTDKIGSTMRIYRSVVLKELTRQIQKLVDPIFWYKYTLNRYYGPFIAFWHKKKFHSNLVNPLRTKHIPKMNKNLEEKKRILQFRSDVSAKPKRRLSGSLGRFPSTI